MTSMWMHRSLEVVLTELLFLPLGIAWFIVLGASYLPDTSNDVFAHGVPVRDGTGWALFALGFSASVITRDYLEGLTDE